MSCGVAEQHCAVELGWITSAGRGYGCDAREKDVGLRVDYFIVSRRLLPRVTGAAIRTEVYGSDHCPVVLEIS